MRKTVPFGAVSIRELSRDPAGVLARIAGGERLLVCRHGYPVATLQPLDGAVVQPFVGAEFDVEGSLLGDAQGEIGKLTEIQKVLLRDCVNMVGRITTGNVPRELSAQAWDGFRSLGERGLARRVPGAGWKVTGRGLILSETLRAADRSPAVDPSAD
jgi:antitoxin (DNA-binding transcriptional repressor) of toxin-antitoxin stability system